MLIFLKKLFVKGDVALAEELAMLTVLICPCLVFSSFSRAIVLEIIFYLINKRKKKKKSMNKYRTEDIWCIKQMQIV